MNVTDALASVRAASERVESAAAEVADAKQDLHRATLRALLDAETDRDAMAALVSHLYWEVPEVQVKTLEVGVGSKARLKELAGPGPVRGTCKGCGCELRATSRTNLAARYPATRCTACEWRRQEEREAAMWGNAPQPTPEAPPDWYPGEADPWADPDWLDEASPPV